MADGQRVLDLEDMKNMYYHELRDKTCGTRSSGIGKYLVCPYCDQRKGYKLSDLMRHACRIGRESTSANLKEKAKHLGLLKYLETYGDTKTELLCLSQIKSKSVSLSHHDSGYVDTTVKDSISGKIPSEENDTPEKPVNKSDLESRDSIPDFPSALCDMSTEVHDLKSDDELVVVFPWMVIVANLPVEEKDGRYVGDSGEKLRDELTTQGYNPEKVSPLWTLRGHSGYAVVDFGKEWSGFKDAIILEKAYEREHQGKKDWQARKGNGDKLYAWVARAADYHSSDEIGKFLQERGDLKPVSVTKKQAEDLRNDIKLMDSLYNALEVNDKKLTEIEKKINHREVQLRNVMKQKDETINNFNTEMKKMEQMAAEELQTIYSHNEHNKMRLEARKEGLLKLEKHLDRCEELNDDAKRGLEEQKEMNERAIMEQKKAEHKLLKLAEEQKREKESLHKRIIELEANIEQKQALALERERLKDAIEEIEHMKLIQDELTEKEVELDGLDSLNRCLIVKERKINDELQEARKKLIECLQDSKAYIRVKRMGQLDDSPFHVVVKRKYTDTEAPEKIAEISSYWEGQLRDPSWHPFKIITDGDKAKEVIDEEDEKLSLLREEFGDEVYKSVITALKEMIEYNLSGRYPVPELWNAEEDRRALLKEGASFILKAWKTCKRKRS